MKLNEQIIFNTKVFKAILPETKEDMLKNSLFTRELSKNTIVLRQGEKCEKLIILIEGVCEGEITNENGKAITVEQMKSPHVLAPAFLFSSNPISPVSVETKSFCILAEISKENLLNYAMKDKTLLLNILTIISDKARFLSSRLSSTVFKSLRGRVCEYILSLPMENGKVNLPYNIEKLAEYLGVSRPSLSRVLSNLSSEKILTHNKGEIIIHSLDKISYEASL